MRSAPKTGYDFGNKRQYRRDVWSEAAEFCKHKKRDAQVLLMPSSEGDEIEVAESYGFQRCNMHVVDRNPAIVAHLKRRYPGINTYGVEIDKALARIKLSEVRLSVANFDLCSSIDKSSDLLQTVCAESFFAEHSLVFATAMRGREAAGFLDEQRKYIREGVAKGWIVCKGSGVIDVLGENDRARSALMFDCLRRESRSFVLKKCPKIYQSNRVSMLWLGVIRLPKANKERWLKMMECNCDHCVRWWALTSGSSASKIKDLFQFAKRTIKKEGEEAWVQAYKERTSEVAS